MKWPERRRHLFLFDLIYLLVGRRLAGANVPDQKLVEETLDSIPIERPEPTPEEPQHLCLDKGYAGEPVEW